MLDLIEAALDKIDIGYERLDGKQQGKVREEAIENMRNDPDKRVFLVSTFL